ncbi:MAG: Stk1 family PASTA domain-containing Ser/Thr kinase [Thermoleophilia bacterium]|jgi:serine/threonine-protein kinase|nr:Stk1 family PASTA domain-containing Ser/Thr kinase [Thermoleophilia bacterium]
MDEHADGAPGPVDDIIGAAPLDGRYRPTRRIGGGGMADVYLAEDLVLGRLVAVKVLRRELALDAQFVERFDTEARAAASLSHPNIVAIHDRGRSGEPWYIVMEYVSGETLKQRVRRVGALPCRDAVAIAVDVLGALQAAHDRGIVHRDVTAQNVLLGDDGRVRVADFGIARIGASSLTKTGMTLGTSLYLSPEQAQGRVADARSDVYGAGVVLYEMLTGRVPFDGETEVAIAWQHVHEAPPRPRELQASVSEALEAVVLRALAKDPGARFQTAAEFAAALVAVAAAERPAPGTDEEHGQTPVVVADAAGAQAPAADTDEAGSRPPAAPAAAPPPATAVAAAPATDAAATALVPGAGGATAATALAGPSPPVAPQPAATGRRSRWWIATVAVVLAAAAVALGYWLFSLTAGPAVPEVVGSSETAARGAIQGEGLRVVTRREYVDGVPAGYVSRQKPRAGVEVADGARVEIWVSRGPATVSVPDLRGLSAAAAEERLGDDDLVAERRNGRSEDVATGDVFSQEPKAGESVGRGETIVYWVSTGLPRVAVPDVVGYSSGEAAALLEEAGLTASVDLTFGWGEYPDTVVEQEPAAGTRLEQGAEVVIKVAVF